MAYRGGRSAVLPTWLAWLALSCCGIGSEPAGDRAPAPYRPAPSGGVGGAGNGPEGNAVTRNPPALRGIPAPVEVPPKSKR
jgi:hypothetical protein